MEVADSFNVGNCLQNSHLFVNVLVKQTINFSVTMSFFQESTNLQVQNKFLKKISGPRADEVKLSFYDVTKRNFYDL